MVMEYVEGRSLRELIDDLGTVPEALLREIALQMAAGVEAIHNEGIVHRDLKPENVLITDDHRIRIMDLGVAKLQEAIRRAHQGGAVRRLAALRGAGAVPRRRGRARGRPLLARRDPLRAGDRHEPVQAGRPRRGHQCPPERRSAAGLRAQPRPLAVCQRSHPRRSAQGRPDERFETVGRSLHKLLDCEREARPGGRSANARCARARPSSRSCACAGRPTLHGRETEELELLAAWTIASEGRPGQHRAARGRGGHRQDAIDRRVLRSLDQERGLPCPVRQLPARVGVWGA